MFKDIPATVPTNCTIKVNIMPKSDIIPKNICCRCIDDKNKVPLLQLRLYKLCVIIKIFYLFYLQNKNIHFYLFKIPSALLLFTLKFVFIFADMADLLAVLVDYYLLH